MAKKAAVKKKDAAVKPVKVLEAGTSVLAEKAMLVKMTIHWWAPFATDDQVNKEAAAKHNATESALRMRKRLLPPSATAAMWTVVGKLRKYNHLLTLPWSDEGNRLLSSMAYLDYVKGINELDAELNEEKKKFIQAYAAAVKNDEQRLGGLYKATDYPAVGDISKKIGVEISVRPVPSGKDFRCDVGTEEMKRIQKSIDEEAQATLQAAVRDVWSRLADVVGKMTERLNAYAVNAEGKVENSFRDSLVNNIGELLDVVPALNILNDPKLDEFCAEIRTKLTQHTGTVLRDDAVIRKTTADAAADIMKKMKGYLG